MTTDKKSTVSRNKLGAVLTAMSAAMAMGGVPHDLLPGLNNNGCSKYKPHVGKKQLARLERSNKATKSAIRPV